VALDAEASIAAEVARELVDRAGGKRDRLAAVGADEVVAMPGHAGDVGGMAVRPEHPTQDINRGEELEGAVDGGPADLWGALPQRPHDLLGRERPIPAEDIVDDGSAGAVER
jgi:hypothetical protein